MSGCDWLWEWSDEACWSLGADIACWPPSDGEPGTSKGSWEGTEVGGRCGGRIFSAMSCSFILLISTMLSSCRSTNSRKVKWGDEMQLNKIISSQKITSHAIHFPYISSQTFSKLIAVSLSHCSSYPKVWYFKVLVFHWQWDWYRHWMTSDHHPKIPKR